MNFLKFFCIFYFVTISLSFAQARVRLPENIQNYRQLNKDEQKFQHIDSFKKTYELPKQYMGKLKYQKRKEPSHLKDAKIYLGFGFRNTWVDSTEFKDTTTTGEQFAQMNAQYGTSFDTSSTTFNATERRSCDEQLGYFGSIGLYWPSGLKTEIEYGSTEFNTNQTITNDSVTEKITFKVDTVMFNVFLDAPSDLSKITPYIGGGIGVVRAKFKPYTNSNKENAAAVQGMVGLSYKLNYNSSVYLGYRYLVAKKLEQTIHETYEEGDNIYYSTSTYEYRYKSHGVDFGFRIGF